MLLKYRRAHCFCLQAAFTFAEGRQTDPLVLANLLRVIRAFVFTQSPVNSSAYYSPVVGCGETRGCKSDGKQLARKRCHIRSGNIVLRTRSKYFNIGSHSRIEPHSVNGVCAFENPDGRIRLGKVDVPKGGDRVIALVALTADLGRHVIRGSLQTSRRWRSEQRCNDRHERKG